MPISANELRAGLALFESVAKLGAFDAVLAAAAIAVGATLVSADSAFAALPGLSYVLPDKTGIERLLEQ